jgi:2-oxo-4-hydroxy-4-carboxy-5-ureidoimidazoline decarboxylase
MIGDIPYRSTARPPTTEEGGGYLVEVPDLPGCMSDGETVGEAIANGEDAMSPTPLPRAEFVARFGGVYEHSPWVAEAAFDAGLPADADTPEGLHQALSAAMRAAPRERQLALIRAHPDLAGRLARAGSLTAASTAEQRSAGLDQCTDDELARFTALNEAYKARFGFPFIMAVKGSTRAEILAAFERRVASDPEAEFGTALDEIDRIALLRLRDMPP